MAELDLWSDANIVGPLLSVGPQDSDLGEVAARVKKAIRTKVLESYRNGQAAGPQRRPYAKR